jgi:hypothetical protein
MPHVRVCAETLNPKPSYAVGAGCQAGALASGPQWAHISKLVNPHCKEGSRPPTPPEWAPPHLPPLHSISRVGSLCLNSFESAPLTGPSRLRAQTLDPEPHAQVVDANWGIHASIPKYIFNGVNDGSSPDWFVPQTLTGTSLPAVCAPLSFYNYPPSIMLP